MRRTFRTAVAASAGLTLFLAAPTQATIFSIAWIGTLDSGNTTQDAGPTIDLAGRPFEIVFSIDDSKGTDTSTPPSFASVSGGTIFGTSGPVSAVVSIDGLAPFSISGETSSFATRTDEEPPGASADSANFLSNEAYDVTESDVRHFHFGDLFAQLVETNPADFGTLFDSTAYDALPIRALLPGDNLQINFVWNDIVTDLVSGTTSQLFIEGVASSATLVAPAAVPEPASWALMIGGFAFAGAVLRRRATIRSLSYA